MSLLLTLSTLYLLDEDPIGSQAEPPLAAASGEASEKAPAPGPGPLVRVREQQPLSSLSSVLLYRGAPDDLRLVFYDEVWERVCRAVWDLPWAVRVGGHRGSGCREPGGCHGVWTVGREAVVGSGNTLDLKPSLVLAGRP